MSEVIKTLSQECGIAEYEALRAEILARVVMRDQMVNYCATIFAALVALAAHVGFDTNQTATSLILFAYPPVALVFAHGWVTHDLRIWQIGSYILHRIDKEVPGLGNWERWLMERRKDDDDRRQNWFALGAFVGTSVVATGLAVAVALMKVEGQSGSIDLRMGLLIALEVLLAYFTGRQIWARSREMRESDEQTTHSQ